jgi:hypothetical protein
MKFLVDARIVPGKDIETEMEAEGMRVSELVAEGLITQVMPRTDGTGAYLLVDAVDADVASTALASLPFAVSGAIELTIDPIQILDL